MTAAQLVERILGKDYEGGGWSKYWSDRIRWKIGDVSDPDEPDPQGGQFEIDLGIGVACGEFDYGGLMKTTYEDGPRWSERVRYASHYLAVCFWRWGAFVSVRGKRL